MPTADPPSSTALTPARPRVLTPMLAIFPGTTAAYAALEFMDHARELSESDRKRIALVYVDIDHQHPDLISFRHRFSGLFNEHILRIAVPHQISYMSRVEQDGDATEPHTYIGSKRPEAFENGARGIRNNGHVAFCHNYRAIADRLVEAIEQITSRDANEENGLPGAVQVSISAFIGGGTASGIVADLACLTRQILNGRSLDQRLALTCILPSDVSDSADIDLRRSNAVACLLEAIALGMAEELDGRPYRKYLRDSRQYVSGGAIANEIYLIGSAGMSNVRDIARTVGLELFHRTLDASGVGALERSLSVNRISLGESDDQGMPTLFGMSCPLEVRFPAQETATAFAQVAAARLLPLLAGYEPVFPPASDEDRARWEAKWQRAAWVDAPDISRGDFADLDAYRLDALWHEVLELGRSAVKQVDATVARTRESEMARIEGDAGTTPEERSRHWQSLVREYEVALAMLEREGAPEVDDRPTLMEHRALGWRTRILGASAGDQVYDAYRARPQSAAEAHRHERLVELLHELRGRAHDRLTVTSEWVSRLNPAQEAARLLQQGTTSAAWRGEMDRRHALQFHLFDLPMFRRDDGGNAAVERLYELATSGIGGGVAGALDYRRFLDPCIAEIAGSDRIERLHQQGPERLSEGIVAYFQRLYERQLRSANLFELLSGVLPEDDQPAGELQRRALSDHVRRLQRAMIDLFTFDERVGGERCINSLKKEVYLAFNWRNGREEELLKAIALASGIKNHGDYVAEYSLDPHRLQVSYMRHAISLGTIYDFFSDTNSAMARYQDYQDAWVQSRRQGRRPPHSCSALEALVERQQLVERLVRVPAGQPNGTGPAVPRGGGR